MILNVIICRSEGYAAKQQQPTAKKFELGKWKYAELRDTINTSCGKYSDWLTDLEHE